MSISVLLSLLLVLVAVLAMYLRKNKYSGLVLPPGPRPWPIIGNLHLLSAACGAHRKLLELSRKYGGVLRLWFGNRLVIFFNDPLIIHETIVKKHLTYGGRVRLPSFAILSADFRDIGFSEGNTWTRLRRVCHSYIGGMSKLLASEDLFVAEKELFFGWLDRQLAATKDGQITQDIGRIIKRYTHNVFARMCFGHRYQYDEKDSGHRTFPIPEELAQEIITLLDEGQKIIVEASLVDWVWWMQYVPGQLGYGHLKNLQVEIDKLWKMLTSILQMHKDTLDENNVRDMMDYLLIQSKEEPLLKDDQLLIATLNDNECGNRYSGKCAHLDHRCSNETSPPTKEGTRGNRYCSWTRSPPTMERRPPTSLLRSFHFRDDAVEATRSICTATSMYTR
jgi:hypothetical protein